MNAPQGLLLDAMGTLIGLRRSVGQIYAETAADHGLELEPEALDAAFAAHEDDIKGSLEPGKLADIVVLDRDLLTCEESEILEARVLYTIVGGKVLYEAD